MGIFEDLGSDAKKIFLAGLGAMSSAADKGEEIVDKLVSKGELTVEEGRQLNTALAHKVQTGTENLRGSVLLKYMKSMTVEQRKEFVKKVVEISDQLDKEEETDFKTQKPQDSCTNEKECDEQSGEAASAPDQASEGDPAGK
ncbi:MAG: phasin family protein [Aeriscardovia sp.]|nr:phasin family protein [Aeriscardovia sp.]MBQ1803419.1 phasin family protein [Aeriscardovia sp.]